MRKCASCQKKTAGYINGEDDMLCFDCRDNARRQASEDYSRWRKEYVDPYINTRWGLGLS